MKNPYPYEKFTNAIEAMAMSPKSIQERVGDAYTYNLSHVKARDLPQQIQHKFIDIKERLTSGEPLGDEGTLLATINQMSEMEVMEIAQVIWDMADVVRRDYYGID